MAFGIQNCGAGATAGRVNKMSRAAYTEFLEDAAAMLAACVKRGGLSLVAPDQERNRDLICLVARGLATYISPEAKPRSDANFATELLQLLVGAGRVQFEPSRRARLIGIIGSTAANRRAAYWARRPKRDDIREAWIT